MTWVTYDKSKKEGRAKVMTVQRKEQIARLLAEDKDNDIIKQDMQNNYQVRVTDNQIKHIRYGMAEHIVEFRKQYLSDITTSDFYHKRVRLAELEKLFKKADEIDNPKDKLTFKLKCLAAAQVESEGKLASSLNLTQNNLYNFTPREINEKIKELKLEFAKTIKSGGE